MTARNAEKKVRMVKRTTDTAYKPYDAIRDKAGWHLPPRHTCLNDTFKAYKITYIVHAIEYDL
jgi:hypothetical protein